jgi:hypothetical protein
VAGDGVAVVVRPVVDGRLVQDALDLLLEDGQGLTGVLRDT